MPKILTDSQYQALVKGSNAYDALVNSILESNTELKKESITTEVIQQMISSNDDGNDTLVTELEGKVQSLTTENENLQSQVESLTAEVNELKELPDEESVTGKKPDADAGASEGVDIAVFADKHAGDTAVILEEMKQQGLL